MTKFKLNTVIIAVAAFFVCGVSQAETKVSGFVDAGYNWVDKGVVQGFAAANSFAVNDGAVYLSHENDGWNVLVDLDFVWAGAGAAAIGTKGQAYVMKSYDSGLWWRLGRYDRIWGHEAVDSIDRTFINAASIYTNAGTSGFGTTDTGVSIGYDFDPITLEVIVANGGNSPTVVTNGTGNGKAIFGGKLGFKSDMFHLGFSFIRDQSVATTLMDILAGVKLGNFTIDLDVTTLSTTNSQFDVASWFIYDFSEAWDFAARFEYLSKAAGTANRNDWEATVGPQYAVSKDTTVKAEVMFGSRGGGTSTSDLGISFAAQHRL